MMTHRKLTPRAEYRLHVNQRVNESASFAEKFPKLKTLTVDLAYFDSVNLAKTGELRYMVNVDHAKSHFCIVCPGVECVGGDFDLSAAVAQAVAGRRKVTEGEIHCRGFRTRAKGDTMPCRNLLRYKLTFGYA